MKVPVQITRVPKHEFYPAVIKMGQRLADIVHTPQIPLGRLTIEVGANIVTPADEPVPECVPCGVCCNYFLILPVTRDDAERTDAYLELTVNGESGPIVVDRILPRDTETGSCLYLGGTLKQEVGCTIYEERPKACHDFEAGSDRCHGVRRAYGLEPPLTEEQVILTLASIDTRHVEPRIKDTVIYPVSSVATFDGTNCSTTVIDTMRIDVLLDEETRIELHQFEAGKEAWYENDFDGLTVEEARSLIAEGLAKNRQV